MAVVDSNILSTIVSNIARYFFKNKFQGFWYGTNEYMNVLVWKIFPLLEILVAPTGYIYKHIWYALFHDQLFVLIRPLARLGL